MAEPLQMPVIIMPPRAAIVVCVETDDFCPPRGVELPLLGTRRRPDFVFASTEYGAVAEGTVYAVWTTGPFAGTVIGEMLDQDHANAARVRALFSLRRPA